MFGVALLLRDHFGDTHGVAGMLNAYGLPAPPTDTIRKWFSRGSVSSEWLPVLVGCVELDSGQPISLAKYLTLGGDNK